MQFETVGGLTHHLSLEGPEGAPVVIFANSLGTDFRIWDGIVPGLLKTHRVLRYDMRGHGLTEAVAGPYSMTDLRDDLIGLMDHLGIDTAAIVGLSVGGMVAQSVAALVPDRVTALVLCDTAHKIGGPDIWNPRIEAVNTGGMASIADAVLLRWFAPGFGDRNPALHAGVYAMLTQTSAVGYAGICAAIRDADLTAGTATIACPALCLCGSDDMATPPDLVAAMADLMPNATFEVIANAGHLPCLEHPGLVADKISAFLSS